MADHDPGTASSPPGEEAALLAVSAHGLLNPITSIMGFAELLLEREHELPAEQRREFLALIRDRARFASELLLDMVRGLPPDTRDLLDRLAEETRRAG